MIAMTIIDFIIGENAEYLNAWTVWVKLLRLPFEAPNSMIIRNYGVSAELLAVIGANGLFSLIIISILRLVIKTS